VTVDLGFNISHKIRVRLYGINTPESRTRDLEEKARGLASKDRLYELLAGALINNHFLLVKTHEKGKYGRYLGTLIRKSTRPTEEEVELNINETLVEEGFAVKYYGGKR
jgi:micrococcal nuclease